MINTNPEIIIIGAGPTGVAAAIQLRRYGLNPSVFERNCVGGLVRNANLIENYPGFPDGIKGIEFAELLKKHIDLLKINVIFEEVINVNYINNKFKIETNKYNYQSDYLIIASGTKPKIIDFFENDIISDGVILYEIVEILNTENKQIIIIGSGDAAFDYAINLSKKNKIIILNRNNSTKCLPLLLDRSLENKNINYTENASILGVNKNENSYSLKYIHNNEIYDLNFDYLVVAIGREPNMAFFNNNLIIEKDNLISNKKLFLIGDVNNGLNRQTSICVGDGVKAAMELYNDIQRKIK